jgi:GT2 family glycosyltransferase
MSTSAPEPRASLILVLDGGPDQVLRCLGSLAALPEEPEHEVVIVDNGSVGLDELFLRLAGDVEIVRQERRTPFAEAATAGLRQARGEIVVLLRGAPEVAPGWLAPLVRALDEPARAAATSISSQDSALPPVAAHVIAVRRADLLGPDGEPALPAAPDAFAVAALCATLARRGAVEPVPASVVQPPGARSTGARLAPGQEPELSIVIPTLDATSDRVRACVAAIHRATDVTHEIVIVDNGAPPQGFTAPVNAGLRAARAPYLLVLNDDVELLPGWWPPLRATLDAGAAVAFPLTIDGGMRYDFAAWCFAMTRDALERHAVAPGEFFDPELVVWFQDTDLLERLRAAHNPPVFVEQSRIRHGLSETVATADPLLRAWIEEQIQRDRARFTAKHGDIAVGVGPAAG